MIKNKRDGLEQFIKEQILGPGACGLNYFLGKKTIENTPESPFKYSNEIINTTPGSLYSTGILFPEKEEKYSESNEQLSNISEIDPLIEIPESDESETDESELLQQTEIDNDDISSLSQRFPNSIGLSCCISKELTNNNINNELEIKISGRYYKKLIKSDLLLISVKIEDVETFENIFIENTKILSHLYNYSKGFLQITKELNNEDYAIEINKLKELDKDFAKKIFGEIYFKIEEKFRFLLSFKEKIFNSILNNINDDGSYIDEKEKNEYINKISLIEKYECFLSYFYDILNLYNIKGFGYWQCESFSQKLDLSNISIEFNENETKKIFSYKNYENLKDVVKYEFETIKKKVSKKMHASLSVLIQVTRDTRDSSNDSNYLKVQLVNTSSKFIEENGIYFSIVTEKVNQLSFFGVEIKVTSKFLQEYRQKQLSKDQYNETEQLEYIYRQFKDYGIGHFCSVDWDKNDQGIPYVKTQFIPSSETPDIEPFPQNKLDWEHKKDKDYFVPKPYIEHSEFLQFKWLSTFSDTTNDEIREGLLNFSTAYKNWIDNLNNENGITQDIIDNCKLDQIRIEDNIKEFLNDDDNILSFRIMNSAMFMQLWHSKNAGKDELNAKMNNSIFKGFNSDFYVSASDKLFEGNVGASWRPFQLAFILLNLDGIYQHSKDFNWEKRNELVDLVWFPTGGGKTEAYLGLIALTIINRRRSYINHGGTTAIMRYTLRLLAIQQFQRATRVIMALELIRSWMKAGYNLGNTCIDIGLYVGDDALPNDLDGLRKECEDAQRYGFKNSKLPINKCPWCGEELYKENENIAFFSEDNNHIKLYCPNIKCSFTNSPFSNSIYFPLTLCDDLIYEYPPTLLFGTVDKFAQLAHTNNKSKDSRKLFGLGINLTPDLIIQDELHLLLGPLGSSVALFECAIDQLCTRKEIKQGKELKIRPKIISSTATTRNAPLQIRALYDRSVNIFPKTGVDSDDSFFAFYKRISKSKEPQKTDITYVSKRKYIGILPTGRTQMTLQMRLSAIFFVHRAIFEKNNIELRGNDGFNKAMNYYFSLISYFNSLREVGKTDAQFYSEFVKFTRRLFNRVMRQGNMLECFYCYDSAFNKCELTGRLKGSEVVNELAKVERNWSVNNRLPHLINNSKKYSRNIMPPDFVVATNMISVGIDISRFNTIIMNSMPRNTAEYIQASSRVGRDNLGLVITLHNPFRTRDISHFERFIEFHEKMYCYIDPISITPFSDKAIDRYLPLYLATIIRHSQIDLSFRDSANNLTPDRAKILKADLKAYFNERLKRTNTLNDIEKNILTHSHYLHIENYIDESIDVWLNEINLKEHLLVYKGAVNNQKTKIKQRNLYVEIDAYDNDEVNSNWKVPMSLRTIEPESVIRIDN